MWLHYNWLELREMKTWKVAAAIINVSALLMLCECAGTTTMVRGNFGATNKCVSDVHSCSFYLTCVDANIPCGGKGYARYDAFFTCLIFQKYVSKLTKAGQNWASVTDQCLREVLVSVAEKKYGRISCTALKRFAFATFQPCFNLLHPVCNLPRNDLKLIKNFIVPQLTAKLQKVISSILNKCRKF
ncbi:hypothetical protein Bhyg_01008 [Pseudolycoriella hygida]|uniref:Stanniocalcin n=1 Tax=Pseudolycoriella hygida TaxID=35572 RepID=A0A9Q0NAK9_9DIPT|nr:hypothetical protein Bhyg_01008 [Pseudolycoriella hygida]